MTVWHMARHLGLLLWAMMLPGLAMAADDVLLRVKPVSGAELRLDRAALEALPQTRFSTQTLWTEGALTFSGPSLRKVLDMAGIKVGTKAGPLVLHALNDYEVQIDPEDIAEDWPIIATRIDGNPFSVRENGPLWLIFPYDRDEEFRRDRIYAVSVWQLVQITEMSE